LLHLYKNKEVQQVLSKGLSLRMRAAAACAAVGLVLLGSGPPASAQSPATNRPQAVDDELLIKFKPGTPAADRVSAHLAANAQVVRTIPGLDVQVVKVGRGQAQQRLQGYLRNPNIQIAELNGIAYPDWVPSDVLFSQQWALNNASDRDIDAPRAWDVANGTHPDASRGSATIAIVDSGIRANHPDLLGKVVDSRNWFADDVTVDDVQGHGTHVAGIAAAITDNETGIAGVCPDCTLVSAKVCDDAGGGCPYDRIANGVLWSVGCEWRDPSDNCLSPLRAKAINISLTGTYNSAVLESAVNKAWGRGAVLACAAGNGGKDERQYPAAYMNCIATAANDNADRRASWSNYGSSWVDVAAPGVSILSTVVSGGYESWSGTSMASPHVAGLAGLLAGEGTERDQVRSQIESRADRIAGTGTLWSKGRINACRAVGLTRC
jgi:thermitase